MRPRVVPLVLTALRLPFKINRLNLDSEAIQTMPPLEPRKPAALVSHLIVPGSCYVSAPYGIPQLILSQCQSDRICFASRTIRNSHTHNKHVITNPTLCLSG
jgi:hypothetical protein